MMLCINYRYLTRGIVVTLYLVSSPLFFSLNNSTQVCKLDARDEKIQLTTLAVRTGLQTIRTYVTVNRKSSGWQYILRTQRWSVKSLNLICVIQDLQQKYRYRHVSA